MSFSPIGNSKGGNDSGLEPCAKCGNLMTQRNYHCIGCKKAVHWFCFAGDPAVNETLGHGAHYWCNSCYGSKRPPSLPGAAKSFPTDSREAGDVLRVSSLKQAAISAAHKIRGLASSKRVSVVGGGANNSSIATVAHSNVPGSNVIVVNPHTSFGSTIPLTATATIPPNATAAFGGTMSNPAGSIPSINADVNSNFTGNISPTSNVTHSSVTAMTMLQLMDYFDCVLPPHNATGNAPGNSCGAAALKSTLSGKRSRSAMSTTGRRSRASTNTNQ
jgi:hypothetical protein